MKVRVNQPDSIDLEHLRDMQDRPGWTLYRRRLAGMHSQAMSQLRVADNWENARYVQGFVAALEAVDALPKVMANEIRARQRKEKGNAVEAG